MNRKILLSFIICLVFCAGFVSSGFAQDAPAAKSSTIEGKIKPKHPHRKTIKHKKHRHQTKHSSRNKVKSMKEDTKDPSSAE